MVTVLLVIRGYWGKGETYTEAMRNLKKLSGSLKRGEKYIMKIYNNTEKDDVWIDDCGSVHYHNDKDRENIKVYDGRETY